MGLPICEVWFETEPVEEGIVRIIEPHVHPLLRANAYVVRVAIAIF